MSGVYESRGVTCRTEDRSGALPDLLMIAASPGSLRQHDLGLAAAFDWMRRTWHDVAHA